VEEALVAARVVVKVGKAARVAIRDLIWGPKAIVHVRNAEPLHPMNKDIPVLNRPVPSAVRK